MSTRHWLMTSTAAAGVGTLLLGSPIAGRALAPAAAPYTETIPNTKVTFDMGLTGHSSVTVVAADATTSDMLATAVSVLGPEKGPQLVDGWAGAAALIGERTPQGDRWIKSAKWHP